MNLNVMQVQNKLQALHKQLEATDSMEEAIQIAKKIRTAKRILFHDDHKSVGAVEPVCLFLLSIGLSRSLQRR